jgi:hypothetical protein
MSAKISLTSFSQLSFNVVMLNPGKKVHKVFPALEWIEKIEVPEGMDRDQMLRLVILLFDKGSPLIHYSNSAERAHLACVYSRIVENKKQKIYPEWVTECVSGNVVSFNIIVMYYLSMVENPRVAILQSMRMAALRLSAEIVKDASAKMVLELEKLENEIKKREKELFSAYSISDKFHLDIDAFLIDDELDLRPEKMAAYRESGKPIFEEFDVYAKI